MIVIDRGDSRPLALRETADLLAAFAHPIRLQLLEQLRSGQQGVGELVHEVQLAQPVVSRHLAILRRAGVVRCERVGREKIYGVVDDRVQPLLELLFTQPNHNDKGQPS